MLCIHLYDDQARLLHWLLPHAVLSVTDCAAQPDAEALLATVDAQVRTALLNDAHRLEPTPALVHLAQYLMHTLALSPTRAYQLADSLWSQTRDHDWTQK